MTTPAKKGDATGVANPKEENKTTALTVINPLKKDETKEVKQPEKPAAAVTVDAAKKKAEHLNELLDTRSTLETHIKNVKEIPTDGMERNSVHLTIQHPGNSYFIVNPSLMMEVKEFLLKWLEDKKAFTEAEIVKAY